MHHFNDNNSERYIVFGGGTGPGHIEPWIATDEPLKDRKAVVEWIASGQLQSIHSVMAYDIKTESCRLCTQEVAREVMNLWAHEGEPISCWKREFIELHVSVRAANSFAMEDA